MESYAPYEWVEWYGGVLAPWYEYRENIKEVYLSDQITELGSYAFQNCHNLNKVNIPKSVTEVGGGVFAGCSGLKEISFPNNVKKITSMVFARCSGLIKVIIPNSVTEIGVAAFGACSNLSEITIPNSVVKIDDEAFFECSSLKKIVILNQNCEILTETSISGNAIIYGYDNSTAESYAKKYKRTFKALDSQTSTYTISYDANGGKNAPAAQTKKKDKTLTLSKTNPTRKGYTFAGWYTSSSYKTKVTKIAKGSTGDRVLYAKWTVNKYIIRYNGNGATSGKMADTKSCQYNKSYTLRKNTFVKKGYTFLGWSGSANGKAKYKDGQTIKNLFSINGKVVNLYAIWQKNE